MSQKKRREIPGIPHWSELCPDLLRCVFKRLSFTELNRTKSVCSSWHTASRGCVPKQNQIPWLILFPRKEEEDNNNNSSSCVLFVPEDKEKAYKTRDLGVDFLESRCLATYSSWLLMLKPLAYLYILNPLTGERIDLPNTKSRILRTSLHGTKACFWIDNRTKDYLVVWTKPNCTVMTKNGVNKWHEFPEWFKEVVYNHMNQKLYVYYDDYSPVKIWDFSGDKPHEEGFFDRFRFNPLDFPDWRNLLEYFTIRLAVTVSGDVLIVSYCQAQYYNKWRFRIYKKNVMTRKWVRIDSLGNEALIFDMRVTVVANDVPGIKRNSIYFSGIAQGRDNPKHIFVYDLITQKIEPLPQCVLSSIRFSDARWFFPSLSYFPFNVSSYICVKSYFLRLSLTSSSKS